MNLKRPEEVKPAGGRGQEAGRKWTDAGGMRRIKGEIMFKKMTDKMKQTYGLAFALYPVTMVLILLTGIYGFFYVGLDMGDTYYEDAYRWARSYTWILDTLLLTAVGTLFTESLPDKLREGRKKLVNILGTVLSVIVAGVFATFGCEGFLDFTSFNLSAKAETVYACVLLAYLLVLPLLILYFRYRESELTFEKYITGVFIKGVQVSIFWVILAVGFLLLCLIFSELIVDMDDWATSIQVLIMGLYVAPSYLMALREPEEKPGKFFEVMIRYVLLIITIVGAAIIYIYMIKIVVTRDIPSNSVFSILAVLFLVAIPVGFMCTCFEADTLLLKIAYALPFIYAPFILLQCYSLISRVVQYGCTPSRYVGFVLIILETAYIVVYGVRRDQVDKILLLMAALTLIAAVVPGVNALAVSRASQTAIIKEYLSGGLDSEDERMRKRLIGAYDYLLNEEGEDYVDKYLTREQQDEIMDLGRYVGEYVYRDYNERAYLNADDSFIPVSGFDYIAGFDNEQSGSVDVSSFSIEIDGYDLGSFDLSEEIDDFKARYEEGDDSTLYGVDVVDISDGCRLYITYIELIYDSESGEISTLRVSGHVACSEAWLEERIN